MRNNQFQGVKLFMLSHDSDTSVGHKVSTIENASINNGREVVDVYQGSRLRQTPIIGDGMFDWLGLISLRMFICNGNPSNNKYM